jgi:hypothetical protein
MTLPATESAMDLNPRESHDRLKKRVLVGIHNKREVSSKCLFCRANSDQDPAEGVLFSQEAKAITKFKSRFFMRCADRPRKSGSTGTSVMDG